MMVAKLLLLLAVLKLAAGACDYKRVCYYATWAPAAPDANLCTHVVVSFIPDIWGCRMGGMPGNPLGYLKNQNPNLKIMVAMGGWGFGDLSKMTNVIKDPACRKQFADDSVQQLRAAGYDGLDLDFEYPGTPRRYEAGRYSPPEDKYRFTSFCEDLQAAYTREAQQTGKSKLLLSVAVGCRKEDMDDGYEPAKLANAADFINLMTYDLHGSFDNFAGHHSALGSRDDEPANQKMYNMKYVVDYWLKDGAPAKKIVLGTATYGKSFRLSNPSQNKPGSPGSHDSWWPYATVCQKLRSGFTEVFDNQLGAPYAYASDGSWVGYDNPQSMRLKGQYVKAKDLGGAMFWATYHDDFQGSCGQGAFPLMNAMKSELEQCSNTGTTAGSSSAGSSGTTAGNSGSTSTSQTATNGPTSPITDFDPCSYTRDTVLPVSVLNRICDTQSEPKKQFLRDPHNCNQFIACGASPRSIIQCSPGLNFNNVGQYCDWPDSAPCTDEKTALASFVPCNSGATTTAASTTAAPTTTTATTTATTTISTTKSTAPTTASTASSSTTSGSTGASTTATSSPTATTQTTTTVPTTTTVNNFDACSYTRDTQLPESVLNKICDVQPDPSKEFATDPHNCNQFVKCKASPRVTGVCPPGLYFRYSCQCCDYYDPALCSNEKTGLAAIVACTTAAPTTTTTTAAPTTTTTKTSAPTTTTKTAAPTTTTKTAAPTTATTTTAAPTTTTTKTTAATTTATTTTTAATQTTTIASTTTTNNFDSCSYTRDTVLPESVLNRICDLQSDPSQEFATDPHNCNQFVKCKASPRITGTCPPGLYFRYSCQCCDYYDPALCSNEKTGLATIAPCTTTASTATTTKTAAPTTSASASSPVGGSTDTSQTTTTVPTTTTVNSFDPCSYTRDTVLPDSVMSRICDMHPDKEFAIDPHNCNQFIRCRASPRTIAVCPSGLRFNAGQYCDWPSSVSDSNEKAALASYVPCVSARPCDPTRKCTTIANIQDPTDCTKYTSCAAIGQLEQCMKCGTGSTKHYFDKATKTCRPTTTFPVWDGCVMT